MSRPLASVRPSSCGGRYEGGEEAEGTDDPPDRCPIDGMLCGEDCPIDESCSGVAGVVD